MLVLIVVGLAAGVITSLSPCVLPVLPVVLASGTNRADRWNSVDRSDRADLPDRADRPDRAERLQAAGRSARAGQPAGAAGARLNRWRPYGVVAGLVIGFSGSVLFGSLVLSALHLPQDLLRDAGVVVLVVIGLSLLVRGSPISWLVRLNGCRSAGSTRTAMGSCWVSG
jgi:cytochrome c biogenesis protein CcdA